MTFYGGMDLSARACQVCVIDEHLCLFVQQKVRNELSGILQLIEPFKEHLQIVVESTFNWYWLVDGLQEAGYIVCLAHTLGLSMLTGPRSKPTAGMPWPWLSCLQRACSPGPTSLPKTPARSGPPPMSCLPRHPARCRIWGPPSPATTPRYPRALPKRHQADRG
jgi:hypothetical protein